MVRRRHTEKVRKHRRNSFALSLERLEERRVFASWTPLTNTPPASMGTMLLQTDGSILAHGAGITNQWYKLTPDTNGSYINGSWSSLASMAQTRLYYGSNVLPDGRVLVLGGEYSSAGNWTNTGEIYSPLNNTWTVMPNFPSTQFGDGQTVLLPNGKILAGNLSDTRCFLYDPSTNTWNATGDKIHGDRSNEETWTLLPDGDVLSYDIFSSISTGIPQAQRYDLDTGTWIDAGTLPAILSTAAIGYEVGSAIRLLDGRIFQIGGNSNTALYNPATNTWAAGPAIPGGRGADDAPSAIMPNGHVIFTVDTPLFKAPTRMLEYDPIANTITEITSSLPAALQTQLNGMASYRGRMLMLPTGEMMFSPDSLAAGSTIYVYAADGAAPDALRPVVSSVAPISSSVFTLTGKQLTGQSAGASYGDDAEMDTNYPIVQLLATDGSGSTYYARSFNWTPGVATGDATVTTQFEVPASVPLGAYELRVIASGIASAPYSFNTFSGMAVLAATPGAGSVVTSALTSFQVTFNEAIVVSSLQSSDLTVNGQPANSVSIDASGKIATFSYNTSPLISQGLQSMSIAASAVTGNSGTGNWAFGASFRYDSQPLTVAATVPAIGGNFTIPATTFNYDVTFNEPIDPSKVATTNLILSQGSVAAAVVQPGNTTVRYTLTGFTAVGSVSISLPSGRLVDQYGNPAFTAFSATYGINTGIAVTSTSPANGSSISTPPTSFIVNFDRAVEGSSLQASDLTVNAVSASGVTLSPAGTAATFIFATSPVSVQGTQNMFLVADSVMATDGTSLAAVNVLFNYDALTLAVSSTNPLAGGVLTLPGPFDIDLTFNEPLDLASVQTTDIQLAGIAGASISQVAFLPGGQTLRATVVGVITEGTLSLSIPANAMRDAFGNPTLTAFSTSFVVDMSAQPFAGTIAAVAPIGSLVYEGQASGIVSFAGDADLHTLGLDPGQTLTLAIASAGTGLQPQVDLLDSSGAVLATSSAAATGATAVLQTVAIAGGNYSIRVKGVGSSVGSYTVRATLNAAVELENAGGTTNDSLATAQVIDSSQLVLDAATNMRRGAVLGGNSLASWADYYSFSADASDSVSIALKAQSGSVTSLQLEDAAGVVLATAVSSASNFDLGIASFDVPATGVYYLHLTGTQAATYGITILVNTTFNTEGSDAAATAIPLGAGGALGFVGGTVSSITVNATDSGWWNSAGTHTSTIKNFLVGTNSNVMYRDYFVFSLAGIVDTITSAQLQIGNPTNGYSSADATETWELYDVSTPLVQLRASGSSQTAIYNDLGSGAVYGTQTVSAANNGGLVNVNLNSASLAAMNTTLGGDFAFGGALTSLSGTANQFMFGFTNGSEAKRLVLGLGDPEDWYSVTLDSTQSSLHLFTSTPGDGAGEFYNALDAKLELYDATGTTLLASGTALSDGRNESLSAAGLTPGATYKVKLTGQAGSRGEYVLHRQADLASPTDIVMGQVTAGGGNSISVSYQVNSASALPFRIGFYNSSNGTYDAADTLGSSWDVTSPSDLTIGSHTLTLTLGTGAGQIVLPGAGAALPGNDFYVLCVANDNASIAEADGNNNTSLLNGVYHLARGDVIVMGTDANNNATVTGTTQLQLTLDGLTVSYTATDITAFDFYPHAGDDTVNGANVSRPMNFFVSSGTDTLTGGLSGSTLFGTGADNAWSVTGQNAGRVNATSFSSIGNLTGGPANDTFAFAAGASLSGTLNGAAGANTLDYTQFTTAVNVNLQSQTSNGLSRAFVGINAIRGGSGTNVLAGANVANAWLINGANTGSVNDLQFVGFATLNGGTAADTFAFAPSGTVGKIDGKSGTDTLDYRAYAAASTVNLQAKTASGIGTNWASIESAIGSGAGDTLVGANSTTLWALANTNAGNAGTFAFAGYANLSGGTSADTFRFADGAAVTGTIDGKAGTNTIDYAAYATGVSVNLQTGKAAHVGTIANIRNIVGGQANDILVGDAAANTISGGGGRNLIIGRLGADTLTAGSGGDILIGGRTSYDANDAALAALMATWGDTTRSYATRVSAIQSGVSYSSSSGTQTAALTTASVFDDQTADTLSGGAGTDWYFARQSGSSKDIVNNRTNGETLTSL